MTDWAWFYAGLHAARAARRGPFQPDTLERLLRAERWVDQRLEAEVALADLAGVACYSRFHFLRLFEAAYGEPPGRWLTRRRLARARALLGDTTLPVTDVSRAVGFHSLGTFSRTFKDAVGEPPIAYRRRVWPSVAVRRRAIPGCWLAALGASPRPPLDGAGSATPEK